MRKLRRLHHRADSAIFWVLEKQARLTGETRSSWRGSDQAEAAAERAGGRAGRRTDAINRETMWITPNLPWPQVNTEKEPLICIDGKRRRQEINMAKQSGHRKQEGKWIWVTSPQNLLFIFGTAIKARQLEMEDREKEGACEWKTQKKVFTLLNGRLTNHDFFH